MIRLVMFQLEVMEVALDQCGTAGERRLAIIDKNRDLYLTSVRVFGTDRKTVKLGKKILIIFDLVRNQSSH